MTLTTSLSSRVSLSFSCNYNCSSINPWLIVKSCSISTFNAQSLSSVLFFSANTWRPFSLSQQGPCSDHLMSHADGSYVLMWGPHLAKDALIYKWNMPSKTTQMCSYLEEIFRQRLPLLPQGETFKFLQIIEEFTFNQSSFSTLPP